MRILGICAIAVLTVCASLAPAQTTDTVPGASRAPYSLELSELRSPQATRESQDKLMHQMLDERIPAFAGDPTSATQRLWENAMWSAKLLDLNTSLTRSGIRKGLLFYKQGREEFQRATLETAYALDPRAFTKQVNSVILETTHPKHFAIAALYLARSAQARGGASGETRARVLRLMRRKFPDWERNPILTTLNYDMTKGRPSRDGAPMPKAPPLRDMLTTQFMTGWPVVYTLQREERNYPGLAVVRRPDGTFMRNPDGTLFHVTHLARSLSNLPGYITNGNTPQGIFSIQGIDVSRNRFIGQTPFLETVLPYEVPPALFFHTDDSKGTTMTEEVYRNLFPAGDATSNTAKKNSPPNWRNYFPVWEAYYAGVAGRSEMLSHGTTVDPSYYMGKSYYPNTPTIGCICAKEFWDETDGHALVSDQLALVKAFLNAAGKDKTQTTSHSPASERPHGFLAILNIDDQTRPVTLDEVIPTILEAEAISKKRP